MLRGCRGGARGGSRFTPSEVDQVAADIRDEPVAPVQDAPETAVGVLSPRVQGRADHHERGSPPAIQGVHQVREMRIEDALGQRPQIGVGRAELRRLEDRSLAAQDDSAVPRAPCRVEPGAQRADLAGSARSPWVAAIATSAPVTLGLAATATTTPSRNGRETAPATRPTSTQVAGSTPIRLVRPVVPTSDNTDDGGDEHGRRGHRHRVATTTTQQRRKGHDEQQYQPAQQCRPDQLEQSQQAALVGVGPVVHERQPEATASDPARTDVLPHPPLGPTFRGAGSDRADGRHGDTTVCTTMCEVLVQQ
jgi:hypothetical protein